MAESPRSLRLFQAGTVSSLVMNTRSISILASKFLIVGALCALLWVLRPMNGQTVRQEAPPREFHVAHEAAAIPAADEIVPKAIQVDEDDEPVVKKAQEVPEDTDDTPPPPPRERTPYHNASDRPDFAGLENPAFRKREGFRGTSS